MGDMRGRAISCDLYAEQVAILARIRDTMVEIIANTKFGFWFEESTALAKEAYETGNISVFVALLNSYEVTQIEETAGYISNCGVYSFHSADLEEALKILPGRQHFVPVAAKHMMACFDKEQLQEAISYILKSSLGLSERMDLLKFAVNQRHSQSHFSVNESRGRLPNQSTKEETPWNSNPSAAEKKLNRNRGNFFEDFAIIEHDGMIFRCRYVVGDGSCFFHAVVDQLESRFSDYSWDYEALRRKAEYEMRNHPERYMKFFLGITSIDHYQNVVSHLSRSGTYAVHSIIQATAEILKHRFEVVKSENGRRYSLTVKPPNTERVLYLGLENEHYWSLLPFSEAQGFNKAVPEHSARRVKSQDLFRV